MDEKFQVGDIVEFIDDGDWCWNGKGSLGVITKVVADYQLYIKWINQEIGNPNYGYSQIDFRLVPETHRKLIQLCFMC
jgi:hypothetical protein